MPEEEQPEQQPTIESGPDAVLEPGTDDNSAAQPPEPDPLSAAAAEIAQWKDMALRARADLENFRKRMAQEKADAIRFGNSQLLESLLPVLDNFHFGLQAAQNDAAAANLLTGLNMVAGQLQTFLADNGVQEIPAVGLAFDPNVHEAVAQQPDAAVAEGAVIAVVRRGYRLRERLLRPASVVVSTGPDK